MLLGDNFWGVIYKLFPTPHYSHYPPPPSLSYIVLRPQIYFIISLNWREIYAKLVEKIHTALKFWFHLIDLTKFWSL